MVTLDDISQHLLIGGCIFLVFQLRKAPVSPCLGGSGEEDFQLCIGKHHRSDVSAVHDNVVFRSYLSLQVKKECPYLGICGNGGRTQRHLGCADIARNIFAVYKNVLNAVNKSQLGRDLGEQGSYLLPVLHICALCDAVIGNRAVKRSRININKAHLSRSPACNGGFSRTCRTVYSNIEAHMITSFQ